MIQFFDFHENYYTGIKGIYFRRILKKIIKIGDLNSKRLLDFGCGRCELKKLLPSVVGYDILPDLSDVADWRNVKFDTVVANEVFYLFSRKELEIFLDELYKCNPKAELIVGISRQGILNNIAKYLGGVKDAYVGTKLSPSEELAVLKDRMNVIDKKTVWFMCNIYLLRFKHL